jgi:thymidine phosphorylase
MVRSEHAAARLGSLLEAVAAAIGLQLRIVTGSGAQPIGRGIGPALEARDVLAVLRGDADAPDDLRARAIALAGALLDMAQAAPTARAEHLARELLGDGRALRKFEAICEAQGGARVPPTAPYAHPVLAPRDGVVVAVDNRRLARVAKLAGAPQAPAAGVEYHSPLGRRVHAGEPLFVVHAQRRGELDYALEYLGAQGDVVVLRETE